MNSEFAILVSPLGCFSHSGTSCTFQRSTQSFHKDCRIADQMHQRKKLVRAILSVRRFTPEVDSLIRCHLRSFDLRDVWQTLPSERKLAVSMDLYERVHLAACGRANGTAAFSNLIGRGSEVRRAVAEVC